MRAEATASRRVRLYRGLASRIWRSPWVERKLHGRAPVLDTAGVASFRHVRCRWYHAASAGELEILYPLILSEGAMGRSLVVTVFSGSDTGVLQRLEGEWARAGLAPSRLLARFSPPEGGWSACLAELKPEVFVTAKYEAWPDLWISLSQARIPLLVVAARARPSIDWARTLCSWLGATPPRSLFLASMDADRDEIQGRYPWVATESVGDPRWDRVWARSQRGNARAAELVRKLSSLPRPWGVLGSVWPEDLEVWREALEGGRVPGTIWLVPHQVSDSAIRSLLEAGGLDESAILRSRGLGSALSLDRHSNWKVLVDEMGILSELYASADWAYVGGGFGARGVHSTIEPGLHGLPIAIGASKADRFPEIAEMSGIGQLTLLEGATALSAWLASTGKIPLAQRLSWERAARGRIGASDRCLRRAEAWLSESS